MAEDEKQSAEQINYFIEQIKSRNGKTNTSSSNEYISPIEMARFLHKQGHSIAIIKTSFKLNEISIPENIESIDQDPNEESGCPCCKPCINKCSKLYESIKPCLDPIIRLMNYLNVITPWLSVIDIGTDILLIISYFNDDNIPNYLAWIVIIILYLQFRFQLFWLISLWFNQGTSEGGMFDTITPFFVIITYIPFIGILLADFLGYCNKGNPDPSIMTNKTRLISSALKLCVDITCSILFFMAPFMFTILTLYCWWKWTQYLLCCKGDAPIEMIDDAHLGITYHKMGWESIRTFLSDWESILESLPQTIITTVVQIKYTLTFDSFNLISLIFSSISLSGTIIKVLVNGGHVAGFTSDWKTP